MKQLEFYPSLLAGDPLDLRASMRELCEADALHVDIFDDSFVPGITWGEHTLRAVVQESDIPVEAHLMVAEPLRWARVAAACGCERVVVHLEVLEDSAIVASQLRDLGVAPGIAISPDTPVQALNGVVAAFDHLLVMTVKPGHAGSQLVENAVARVREARALLDRVSPSTTLGVDGGVTAGNLAPMMMHGIDSAVVGTYLFSEGNPKLALATLKWLFTRGQEPQTKGEER